MFNTLEVEVTSSINTGTFKQSFANFSAKHSNEHETQQN